MALAPDVEEEVEGPCCACPKGAWVFAQRVEEEVVGEFGDYEEEEGLFVYWLISFLP